METFSALLARCAGIHRSLVNYPHKGQWRGALMFSAICAWINGWVNNREAGVLWRHRGHCDVIAMSNAVHPMKNAWFYLIVVRLLPSYRIACNICHEIWTQLYCTSFMFYCYCYHFVYYDYYYCYYQYHFITMWLPQYWAVWLKSISPNNKTTNHNQRLTMHLLLMINCTNIQLRKIKTHKLWIKCSLMHG